MAGRNTGPGVSAAKVHICNESVDRSFITCLQIKATPHTFVTAGVNEGCIETTEEDVLCLSDAALVGLELA